MTELTDIKTRKHYLRTFQDIESSLRQAVQVVTGLPIGRVVREFEQNVVRGSSNDVYATLQFAVSKPQGTPTTTDVDTEDGLRNYHTQYYQGMCRITFYRSPEGELGAYDYADLLSQSYTDKTFQRYLAERGIGLNWLTSYKITTQEINTIYEQRATLDFSMMIQSSSFDDISNITVDNINVDLYIPGITYRRYSPVILSEGNYLVLTDSKNTTFSVKVLKEEIGFNED